MHLFSHATTSSSSRRAWVKNEAGVRNRMRGLDGRFGQAVPQLRILRVNNGQYLGPKRIDTSAPIRTKLRTSAKNLLLRECRFFGGGVLSRGLRGLLGVCEQSLDHAIPLALRFGGLGLLPFAPLGAVPV